MHNVCAQLRIKLPLQQLMRMAFFVSPNQLRFCGALLLQQLSLKWVEVQQEDKEMFYIWNKVRAIRMKILRDLHGTYLRRFYVAPFLILLYSPSSSATADGQMHLCMKLVCAQRNIDYVQCNCRMCGWRRHIWDLALVFMYPERLCGTAISRAGYFYYYIRYNTHSLAHSKPG